jgi:hypothetical protein
LKRKLILLNLMLAALTAVAAWQLRVRWLAAKKHENEVLGLKVPAAPAPPYNALQSVQPPVPAQYIDIANKVLFNRERNPNVLVEVAPPPPPPPMPALPVIRGVLYIDGPTAIMSEKAGGSQKEVRPGEQIGEFKLLAVNTEEVVLEWNGEQVRRRVSELRDRSEAAPPPAAASTPQPAVQLNKPAVIQKTTGPGVDMGAGRKACSPGDAANTPDGTVVDGLKKVSWDTPFGKGCAWEAAK